MEGLPTDIYQLILKREPTSAAALFGTCTTLRRSEEFRKKFLVDLLAREADTHTSFSWFRVPKTCFEIACGYLPEFWRLYDFERSPFAATKDDVIKILLEHKDHPRAARALEIAQSEPAPWSIGRGDERDTLVLLFEVKMREKHQIYKAQVLSECSMEQLWRMFGETYRRKRYVQEKIG